MVGNRIPAVHSQSTASFFPLWQQNPDCNSGNQILRSPETIWWRIFHWDFMQVLTRFTSFVLLNENSIVYYIVKHSLYNCGNIIYSQSRIAFLSCDTLFFLKFSFCYENYMDYFQSNQFHCGISASLGQCVIYILLSQMPHSISLQGTYLSLQQIPIR